MSGPDRTLQLVLLTESGLIPSDPTADVRGRTVVTSAGEDVGNVDDLLVDDEEARVRFLRVAEGGFLGLGASHYLVPVAAITRIDADRVHITRDRDELRGAPVYDPDLAETGDYYSTVNSWWGYPSPAAPPYAYPLMP